MLRLDDGAAPTEEWTECGAERAIDEAAVFDERIAPSEGEADVEATGEVEQDEDGSGDTGRGRAATAPFLSLSARAMRFGLGEDRGSGPATADRRSNGSSDVSGADGDKGEERRGEWPSGDEERRSSSKRERNEEAAVAVAAGDACQLDMDMGGAVGLI